MSVKAAMNDNDQCWAKQKRKPANVIIDAKALLKVKTLVDNADAGKGNARNRQGDKPRCQPRGNTFHDSYFIAA